MFESIVQHVLTRLLGDYLGELADGNISFALLQGQLHLENITLNSQKLVNGLQLDSGLVGRFSLSIPLGSIFSPSTNCWTLEIVDLFVLTSFYNSNDVEVESVNESSWILNQLSAWSQTIQGICSRIQVVVKNVHVQFRDLSSNIPHVFGLRVQCILIDLFGSVDEPQRLNKVHIHGLKLYLDLLEDSYSNYSNVSVDTLKKMLSPQTHKDTLIEIEKLDVRVMRNLSEENNGESMEIWISISTHSLQLTLTNQQIDYFLNLYTQHPIKDNQLNNNTIFGLEYYCQQLMLMFEKGQRFFHLLSGQQIESVKLDFQVENTQLELIDNLTHLKSFVELEKLQFAFTLSIRHVDFDLKNHQFYIEVREYLTQINGDEFFDAVEEHVDVNECVKILVLKRSHSSDNFLSLHFNSTNHRLPSLKIVCSHIELSIDESFFAYIFSNFTNVCHLLEFIALAFDIANIDLCVKEVKIDLRIRRFKWNDRNCLEAYVCNWPISCSIDLPNSSILLHLIDQFSIQLEFNQFNANEYALNIELLVGSNVEIDFMDCLLVKSLIQILIRWHNELFQLKDLFKINAINITQVLANTHHLIVYFLQRPLYRLEIKDLRINYLNEKANLNVTKLMDYYNEKKKGWEPLMNINGLNIQFNENKMELKVMAVSPIQLIITQQHIYQLINSIQQIQPIINSFNKKHTIGVDEFNQRSSFDIETSLQMCLINEQNEELVFMCVNECKCVGKLIGNELQMSVQMGSLQIDNQLIDSNQWQFFYCSNGNNDNKSIPAFRLEVSINLNEFLHFDCLRLKFSSINVNADELLMRKLLKFVLDVFDRLKMENINKEKKETAIYFGNLELDFGQLMLSAKTHSRQKMPLELQELFDVPLVSFENAQIELFTYRLLKHKFVGFDEIMWHLFDFYFYQILRQLFSIVSQMDAFGAPSTLTTCVEQSLHQLVFNGDLSGFISTMSHGLTNSVSKLAAAMSHGVGQLTYDPDHEIARNISIDQGNIDQTAFFHLYTGFKRLGHGFYGGLTAMAKNTSMATHSNGIKGLLDGFATGAVDTVTKPTQGLLDLLEATALAMQFVVSTQPLTTLLGFPEKRLRLPQICNESEVIIRYDKEWTKRQHELKVILGSEWKRESLQSHMECYSINIDNIQHQQHAYLTNNCLILTRKMDNSMSEICQQIEYTEIKSCQAVLLKKHPHFLCGVELKYKDIDNNQPTLIMCLSTSVAKQLAFMLKEIIV